MLVFVWLIPAISRHFVRTNLQIKYIKSIFSDFAQTTGSYKSNNNTSKFVTVSDFTGRTYFLAWKNADCESFCMCCCEVAHLRRQSVSVVAPEAWLSPLSAEPSPPGLSGQKGVEEPGRSRLMSQNGSMVVETPLGRVEGDRRGFNVATPSVNTGRQSSSQTGGGSRVETLARRHRGPPRCGEAGS